MNADPEIMPPTPQPSRPAEFTDDIFQEICDRMTAGQGLRKICEDPEMPSRQTFLRWVEKDTGRQAKYTAAREALMDWYSEEILTIAWDDSSDTIKGKDGEPKCNHEWINRSRLKVDTLKFLMAKLHPKRYGEAKELAPPPAADEMVISWQPTVKVIVYPMFRDDGSVIKPDTLEYDAAVEKAGREAKARGLTHIQIGTELKDDDGKRPPAQIAYQPEPLPNDLSPEDWSLLTDVLNIIRRTVPTDSNAMPETIFRIIRQALLMHFRDVEIEARDDAA